MTEGSVSSGEELIHLIRGGEPRRFRILAKILDRGKEHGGSVRKDRL